MFDYERSFIGENSKMSDYHSLARDQFLNRYPYISETEYNETKRIADHVAGIRRELELLLREANGGKEPGSDKLETLCTKLGGHNLDDELFDFNYKEILTTVHLDEDAGFLYLSDTCDIYDGSREGMVVDGYHFAGNTEQRDIDEPETEAPPIWDIGERPSPYRDGNAEGPHPSDCENVNWVFRVEYSYAGANNERLSETIEYPTDIEAISRLVENAGIDGSSSRVFYISGFESILPELVDALPDNAGINELNYLAVKIAAMHPQEYELFAAAVEANRHCGSIEGIINITENIGCFGLQPAFTAEQYGEFLLDMYKDETSGVFRRLEQSDNPDELAFVQHILRIEAHVDHAALGHDAMMTEDGVFTERGYLTESKNAFKAAYRGPEDIPAKHLVFFPPEPEPPVKVANADLTALLLQMHALGGDYMTDARYNLNVLEARRSPEYLLLITDKRIFITEAAHAYRHGTEAYDAFIYLNDKPGVKAFALHITDVHQPYVIGDVVALDLGDLQDNIRQHSIRHTRIDAQQKFGPDISFTPEQWEAMDGIDRSMLSSWVRHFEDFDYQAVIHHLQDVCNSHAEISGNITPDTFLSDLNDAYMRQAENPQPDMLRVNIHAAKEILKHGDADVYRMFPDGPQKLSPLDAMPSRGGLWYMQNREFAVNKDEMAGLDKWAEREAKALITVNQPDRAGPDKKKSQPEL